MLIKFLKTEIETVKKIIINCGLHPGNIHRLEKKKMRTEQLWFEQHTKRFGIKIDDKIKCIREYVNKEKLIRSFKCNNSLCPRRGLNKQKC